LGQRRAEQQLLHRGHPAQAAEAQEELPGPDQERGGDGLSGAK